MSASPNAVTWTYRAWWIPYSVVPFMSMMLPPSTTLFLCEMSGRLFRIAWPSGKFVRVSLQESYVRRCCVAAVDGRRTLDEGLIREALVLRASSSVDSFIFWRPLRATMRSTPVGVTLDLPDDKTWRMPNLVSYLFTYVYLAIRLDMHPILQSNPRAGEKRLFLLPPIR